MRNWPGLAGIGRHLRGLVHPVVAEDPRLRAQHQWFIGTRLAIGCAGLATVPVALAASGGLPAALVVGIVAFAAQAVLALRVARTGRLTGPLAISGISLCAAFWWIAAHGEGLQNQVLALLPILTVEAAAIGRRRSLGLVAGASLAALLALAVMPGGPADRVRIASDLVQDITLLAAAVGIGLYIIRQLELRRAREEEVIVQRRLIIDGFGDLVTHHDEQGTVLSAGESAQAVLGTPAGSLLGRGLFERVHVADRPAFLTAISEAVTRDRMTHAQLRVRLGAVADRLQPPVFGWFELRARAIPGGPQPRGHVLCLLRDVSAQHERSEALERSRREADLANALKSRFLAMVSHELRTPLNAIIGFSEILASDSLVPADPARRREYAEIVNSSGQHLLGVVNTLLDISQIEAGTFPLDPEPVSFADLTAGVLDMMRLKAAAAGVALESELPADLPEIVADRRACRQVLLNLLSNAVKFTPAGGRVVVGATRQVDGVALTVSDTGIGIASDDLPRVGEPFFQARSGHDRPFEGTGLGLSVVRGLVGLHGGSLKIDSTPGQGTVVTVRLPWSAASTREGPPPVVVTQAFQPPRPATPAVAASTPPASSPDTPRVKKRA